MTTTLLIAIALLAALVGKYLLPSRERCPECQAIRKDDSPICSCGWIFDPPEDDQPLEYGDSDEDP